MPLFLPSMPAPPLIGYETALIGAAATLTAGKIYFYCVMVYTPVTVTQMRCQFSGVPTGNCDMGIYDSTGTNGLPNNLLGHTGAIAATTGVFTQNLTANLALSPAKYWLAWLDTIADSIFSRGTTGIGQFPLTSSNATNFTSLPGSIAAFSNIVTVVTIEALVSGGLT